MADRDFTIFDDPDKILPADTATKVVLDNFHHGRDRLVRRMKDKWDEWYKAYRSVIDIDDDDIRSNVSVPLIFSHIEAYLPRMVANKPRVEVWGRGPEDARRAALHRAHIFYDWDVANVPGFLVNFVKSAMIYGTAWAKVYHRSEVREALVRKRVSVPQYNVFGFEAGTTEEMQDVVQKFQVWKQEYGGEFTTQAGLIWPDFKNQMQPLGHIFDPDDFNIDKNWNIIRAIDVGVRHPTACLWAAVDEESNVWVYREYEEVNPIHEAHAEAIAALSEEPVYRSFISPDAKRKGGLATQDGQPNLCALDIYRRSGLYAVPAADQVSPGIGTVAAYFRATISDSTSHPKLMISKNCRKLRDGLLNYVWSDPKVYKELDAAEKPRKYSDDLMDALRYLVSSRPVHTPIWYEEEKDYEQTDPGRGVRGLATVPY